MDRGFLTPQSRVHAETIQLVRADQVDRARGSHTFEHGAHWTEHEIPSLIDQDQGRVEISCPDKLENLRECLHDLLDHSLDVVALNCAHLDRSISLADAYGCISEARSSSSFRSRSLSVIAAARSNSIRAS